MIDELLKASVAGPMPFRISSGILVVLIIIWVIWGAKITHNKSLQETANNTSSNISSPQNLSIIDKLESNSMWSIPNSQGDRRSYLRLLSLKNAPQDDVTKDYLTTSIEKIEASYRTDIMRIQIEPVRNTHSWWICKDSAKPCQDGFEEPANYKAQNVISHLSYSLWQERGRAASILRNIHTAYGKFNKEQLFEGLIGRLDPEKENSLFVAKLAFETYKDLTKFKPKSDHVFAFEEAMRHWKENKENVLNIIF